jgi:hypothetical protein
MDLKTLRLASIALTDTLLSQYLAYQRALVRELDKTSPDTDWSGRFAFAHSHALVEAKLDAVTYGKVKALVGDFCSHESTVKQLRERLERAKASPDGSKKEQQVIARAEVQLPTLEADTSLAERYGKEAISLLSAHGDEVMRLHREVARREGCTRI